MPLEYTLAWWDDPSGFWECRECGKGRGSSRDSSRLLRRAERAAAAPPAERLLEIENPDPQGIAGIDERGEINRRRGGS